MTLNMNLLNLNISSHLFDWYIDPLLDNITIYENEDQVITNIGDVA